MAAPSTDPDFLAKKQLLLDLVNGKNCTAANYIGTNANNYDDMFQALFEFSKTFDCDPTYLDSIFAIFDDAVLVGYGIYYNKTGITITNPTFVVNCTNVDIVRNTGGLIKEINIGDNSQVNLLTVSNSSIVQILNVGGGSIVNLITVEAGSCINAVLIKACDSFISKVLKITENTCNMQILQDEFAEFGGFECYVPPIFLP